MNNFNNIYPPYYDPLMEQDSDFQFAQNSNQYSAQSPVVGQKRARNTSQQSKGKNYGPDELSQMIFSMYLERPASVAFVDYKARFPASTRTKNSYVVKYKYGFIFFKTYSC